MLVGQDIACLKRRNPGGRTDGWNSWQSWSSAGLLTISQLGKELEVWREKRHSENMQFRHRQQIGTNNWTMTGCFKLEQSLANALLLLQVTPTVLWGTAKTYHFGPDLLTLKASYSMNSPWNQYENFWNMVLLSMSQGGKIWLLDNYSVGLIFHCLAPCVVISTFAECKMGLKCFHKWKGAQKLIW